MDVFSFEEKKGYGLISVGQQDRSMHKQRKLNEVQIHENKSYDDLIHRVKFKEFDHYPNQHFQPGIKFFKFLARKPSNKELNKFSLLKLWIPDTIVYEQGIDPFWIYSGFDGLVYRTEKFYDKTVVSKLGNKYQLNELSAIIKYEGFDDHGNANGNEVVLQSTKDLAIKIANKKSESESMVIQRFIKCKGSNAFICRAHWRRKKAATCFIITNKLPFHDRDESQWQPGAEYERYVTNQAQRFACSIIESKGNSTYQEPVLMAENIAKYVEKNTGARFSDIVADFIKDEFGIWWLVNVKAFALEKPDLKLKNLKGYTGIADVEVASDSDNEEKQDKNEKEDVDLFQKMSICKFCQLGFTLASMRHKLTLKQIINTEKYIKDIGFNKEWLTHGEAPSSIDPFVLYQPFSVCKDCYQLHKQVQRLKVAHQDFAAVFGIEVKDSDVAGLQGDNERELMDPDKMIDYIIEKHFSQPPEFGKSPKSGDSINKASVDLSAKKQDVMSIPNLLRYKLLIIVYELCEISPIPKNYYKDLSLEYKLLNREFKTKLNCSQSFNSDVDFIPVNSMQLYHFFADDAEKPIKLLELEKRMQIEFKTPTGKVVGRVNLSLNDFKSPLVNQKQYYQLVTFDKFIGYLRCAICWDAGQEKVDVKALKLAMHDKITGIYYPPNDYCACDGLPDEWIRLIPNINQQQHLMQEKLLSYRLGTMREEHLSHSKTQLTQFTIDEEGNPTGKKSYSHAYTLGSAVGGIRKKSGTQRQASQSPVSDQKKASFDPNLTHQRQDTGVFLSSRKQRKSELVTSSKQRPKTSHQPVSNRVARDLSEGNLYRKSQGLKQSVIEEVKARPKSKYMESHQSSNAQISNTQLLERPTTAGTMSSKLLLRKQASLKNLQPRNMKSMFKGQSHQQLPFVQSNQIQNSGMGAQLQYPQMARLLEGTSQFKKYSVLNEKGLDKYLNQKLQENVSGISQTQKLL